MLHATHRIMELIDVLLILGVFLPVFFVAIWQLNRLNPTKKSVKAGDQGVKEMYGVFTSQVNDVLKIKDKQISSLSTKLRLYETDEEEEKSPKEEEVSFEEITKLVQTTFPQYAKVLPLFKGQIMKATKGMSMEEILTYVKQFTGNQESQGLFNPESLAWNKDWA